jgi:TatD DNase family protein
MEFQFIDTHAHLDDPAFDDDRVEVLKRAEEAGLSSIITVGCWKPETGFGSLPELVASNDFLYMALGVHPHDAIGAAGSSKALDLIREFAGKGKKLVAIGETGLDYHYDHSPPKDQRELFVSQIALARELNLPIIVHTREAEDDTLSILKDEGANEIGGVMHCFSGSARLANEALSLGLYLSFSGIVTFPKAEEIREVARHAPTERILIETDCPYLTPVPNRGKRNEPMNVIDTAKVIAEARGVTVEDIARITTLNANELFALETDVPREVRIAYKIRNSLYLNITNRCSNHCTFCAKFKSYTVKGHYLRLGEEPSEAEIFNAIGPNPEEYDEVVFCGFGEPLIRLDLVRSIGLRLKKMGCKIRVDTDGLANLFHGKNVLPQLKFVDTISVSLNAPDSKSYQELIKTPFGDDSYPAILFFLREAKKHIAKVVATAVSVPGVDMEACRKVAEDDIGVLFRVREYNRVG